MAASVKITGKLRLLTPQRQQYKPYAYELEFDNVGVELEVPANGVEKKGQEIVLNLIGFTAVISQLCDAIDGMHDDYVNRQRRAGKI
jgi:hypothetical protein